MAEVLALLMAGLLATALAHHIKTWLRPLAARDDLPRWPRRFVIAGMVLAPSLLGLLLVLGLRVLFASFDLPTALIDIAIEVEGLTVREARTRAPMARSTGVHVFESRATLRAVHVAGADFTALTMSSRMARSSTRSGGSRDMKRWAACALLRMQVSGWPSSCASEPDRVLKVAESGIRDRDDTKRIEAAGYDAILVGETLVTSGDPAAAVRDLIAC